MIKITLIGHECFYGLNDVLRLFFGAAREDRELGFLECDAPIDLDIVSKYDDKVLTYVKGEEERWESEFKSAFDGQLPLKREVKRQLYYMLSKITGLEFPWGCLTGIRPTIVAGEEKDPDALVRKYMVRPDKARLCIDTYRKEEQILELEEADAMNIYIGVPFCPTRCAYCSFVSQEISHHLGRLHEYADALVKEIAIIGPKLKAVASLYVGGGTPTVFDEDDLKKVMDAVSRYIRFTEPHEITVEAGRPDTLSEEKLRILKDHGVQRICINPQTLNDETLRKFNRAHTAKDYVNIVKKAQEIGFEVINSDLIAGLNSEEPEELIGSLEELFELKVENITIHTLYKKRRAVIGRDDVMGRSDRLDEVLSKAYEMLEGKGYKPYYMYRQKDTSHGLENVGFALEGTECLYNVAMMTDKRDVLAIGAGSVSKRMFDNGRLERFSTTKDVIGYIREPEEIAKGKLTFFELG